MADKWERLYWFCLEYVYRRPAAGTRDLLLTRALSPSMSLCYFCRRLVQYVFACYNVFLSILKLIK